MDGMTPPGLTEFVRLYQADFLMEIRTLLEEVDLALVNLEADPAGRDALYDAYAYFHAIGGLLELLEEKTGVRISQGSEDLIETVRKYKPAAEPQVINHLVQSARFLRRMATDTTVSGDSRFTGEVGQHLAAMAQTRSDLMMEVRQSLERETRIGEILIREGTMEASEVEDILNRQRSTQGKAKFGELLLREKRVEAADVIRAIRMQKQRAASVADPSVRVPLDRLDEILHLVEEARLRCRGIQEESILRFGSKDRFTGESTGMAERLEDLHKVMSALRMVPLHPLFARLSGTIGSRLEELHRPVRLTTMGETLEMDKDLVDKLFPLLAELLTRMLDAATGGDAEDAMGLMEMVAYRDVDGAHIDITGDGRCDLDALLSQPAHEASLHAFARLGGRLRMDEGKGAGIRARLLFPEQEEKR